jgi:hypothetical protein
LCGARLPLTKFEGKKAIWELEAELGRSATATAQFRNRAFSPPGHVPGVWISGI